MPAYLTGWAGDDSLLDKAFDDPLYTFDKSGSRRELQVTAFELTLSDIKGFDLTIDGLVEVTTVGQHDLLGGPVFTANNEVCGIILAYDVIISIISHH